MHVPLSLCAESDLTSEYEWQATTNAENIIARYSAVIFFVLSIKLTYVELVTLERTLK